METDEKEITDTDKENEEAAAQIDEGDEKKEDAESKQVQDEAKEEQAMEVQQEAEEKAQEKENPEQETQPAMATAEDQQADPGTVLLTGLRYVVHENHPSPPLEHILIESAKFIEN